MFTVNFFIVILAALVVAGVVDSIAKSLGCTASIPSYGKAVEKMNRGMKHEANSSDSQG